ncbi:MAG: hypothetical protein JNL13_08570 [Chitinophagaceae bacterium]|nr:hypothetical protein [Chitinophagaceae bacterium]
MNKGKWTIFLLCLLCLACQKNDTDAIPESALGAPVITGYKLIDINGQAAGMVGTPNGKEEANKGSDTYRLRIFPIPALNFVGVRLSFPREGLEKKVWIKQGRLEDKALDQYKLGMYNPEAGTTIFQATTTEDFLNIDASAFPGGYYRLYVSSGDIELYENIVIQK